MWSTFLTTLRINLREKSSLFWLFCFPILLSTMFLGMFGNLSATYEVTTMRFAMVANGDYCKSEGAQQLVAAMQRTPVTPQACDTAPDAMDVDSGVTDLRDLLDVTPVDNAADDDQPRDRLERERYDEHPGIAGLVEHPRWRNRHVQPAGAHRGANHGIRPSRVRQ